MRNNRLALCAARSAIAQAFQQRILHTIEAAAAPAALSVAEALKHSHAVTDHERRIREMYQAAPDTSTEPVAASASRQQRRLPSVEQVAARLNSSKGTSCSTSTSTTDTNTGIDWREAVVMLHASDRQQLQQNMLTDTFRYAVLPSILMLVYWTVEHQLLMLSPGDSILTCESH